MKWSWPFRPQETKSVPPLIALSQLAAPHWGGRTGRALTRDGYMQNAVAFRCVRMVAEAAASVPFKAEGEGALQLLRRPQPDLSGRALLEQIYTYLQLYGEAFVEAVQIEADGPPRALFSLSPDRVTPISGERGWAERYQVKERGYERTVRRDGLGWMAMLHIKGGFNPTDEARGLPPLGAARRALDLHNASADWAKALIDNSAKPSGALVYGKDGAQLTDAQYDRLKRELQDGYSGALNAGRPLLLEGGLDWKPMSLSPTEMDFLEARNGAAREIALALGVPPMLLGIPGDNTYANYREAQTAFWRLTVLPLAGRVAEALSVWLDDPFEGAVFSLDLDGVPALSAERESLWMRLEQASFLTQDEKRSMAGVQA